MRKTVKDKLFQKFFLVNFKKPRFSVWVIKFFSSLDMNSEKLPFSASNKINLIELGSE